MGVGDRRGLDATTDADAQLNFIIPLAWANCKKSNKKMKEHNG